MFALERNRLIRKYLLERHQADVHTLSDLLNVSEVTIRRDLEKLERDGFLTRTHGGAVLVEAEQPDDDSLNSEDKTNQQYVDIGRTASRLVLDGEAVMILSGPLGRALAQALVEKNNITVLTNDLITASILAKNEKSRVVLLGGDLYGSDMAVYGALTSEDIHRFHVDRLFTQVDGFGANFELSVSTQEQAQLIREGRLRAKDFVLLCDEKAFHENAFFSFGTAKEGDIIVTGTGLADEDKQRIFDGNLRLFTTADIYEGTVER